MKRSDFGRFRSFELYLNRTIGRCLKSECVWISDVDCISIVILIKNCNVAGGMDFNVKVVVIQLKIVNLTVLLGMSYGTYLS